MCPEVAAGATPGHMHAALSLAASESASDRRLQLPKAAWIARALGMPHSMLKFSSALSLLRRRSLASWGCMPR